MPAQLTETLETLVNWLSTVFRPRFKFNYIPIAYRAVSVLLLRPERLHTRLLRILDLLASFCVLKSLEIILSTDLSLAIIDNQLLSNKNTSPHRPRYIA